MRVLSKSKIQAYRQCRKRLWLQVYRPELAIVDKLSQEKFETGHRVGELARSLFPDGVLIDAKSNQEALAQTRQEMKQGNRPLFEAAFVGDGVLVRTDLLLPEKKGLRIVEVKSTASVKPYHLEDVAIQAWAMRQAGVPIASVQIAHIDSGFLYQGGGDYRGLFAHVEVSNAVQSLQDKVQMWVEAAKATLKVNEPLVEVGRQCHEPFDCPFLGYCAPDGEPEVDRYSVDVLYRAPKLAAQLREVGYDDLRHVPIERLTKPIHQRMWRVAQSGKAELDTAAGMHLRSLSYPRYFMDFETTSMAVPIWPMTRPFQAIPFQWSYHVEMADGAMAHREFLASGINDPSRAFAESLIDALGSAGPILVYNQGTEGSHMKKLADHFPDLAGPLYAAVERVVDLLPMTRAHYYHPDMRGKFSIKNVLPTIAPELSYEGMEVGDGTMAQLAFAEMMDSSTPMKRQAQIRSALLEYCKLDTLAMVRLAHFFEGRKSPGRGNE